MIKSIVIIKTLLDGDDICGDVEQMEILNLSRVEIMGKVEYYYVFLVVINKIIDLMEFSNR